MTDVLARAPCLPGGGKNKVLNGVKNLSKKTEEKSPGSVALMEALKTGSIQLSERQRISCIVLIVQ